MRKIKHLRVLKIFTIKLLFAALGIIIVTTNALPEASANSSQSCSQVFSTTRQNLTSTIPLVSMDRRYLGEDQGLYLDPVTKKPWQVKYFTEPELNFFELKIRRGLFFNKDGEKVNSEFNGDSMSFISNLVVIDKDHRIFMLPYEQRGLLHHSSLSRGQDVLFAGTIAFFHGQITELSNRSGHYKPTRQQTLLALRDLKNRGANLSSLKLKLRKRATEDYHLNATEVARLLENLPP